MMVRAEVPGGRNPFGRHQLGLPDGSVEEK